MHPSTKSMRKILHINYTRFVRTSAYCRNATAAAVAMDRENMHVAPPCLRDVARQMINERAQRERNPYPHLLCA